MGQQHWVLWDGDCGFCRRCVEWLTVRDARQVFHPVAYQAAPSPPMTPELFAGCAQAVHVVTSDGKVLRGGRAALFLLDQIGWGWLARPLSLPPLVWAVEIAYRIVATHRQFFSRLLFPRAQDRTPV